MTAIAGLVHGDEIYIGGDSLSIDLGTLDCVISSGSKVFVKSTGVIPNILFGISGSARMGQVLQYCFDVSDLDVESCDDLTQYMVVSFVPLVKKTFTENGFGRISPIEEDGDMGGLFLVGIKSSHGSYLFRIDDDYQVERNLCGYDAVGSASGIVLGSLYSSKNKHPKERIEMALLAAQEFNAAVSGPFVIKKI
jgi:hypothetical protein